MDELNVKLKISVYSWDCGVCRTSIFFSENFTTKNIVMYRQ